MHKVVCVLTVLYVLAVVVFSGCTTIETPEEIAEPPAAPVSFATSFDPVSPAAFAETGSTPPAIAPISKTLSVDLGLQVVNFKTSFFEKKETLDPLSGVLQDGSTRRYLNVLATSQSPAGGLQGEGEFSYSMPDSSAPECNCDEEPRMLRFGVKDRWAGFGFGADYRSLGKGFVFVTGEKVAQPRDEAQFWVERVVGLFNLRGTIGESGERLTDINQFRLTKTASAKINFNQPAWGGGLISSFSLVGQDGDNSQDSTVFSNTLTGIYRPVRGLSLASNFTIKQQRSITTGIRTDSPGAGVTVLYSPWPDRLSLSSSTSYTRSYNDGGPAATGTLGLTSGVNWKLGRFLAANDVLSFNLKYNRQLDFLFPSASHDDFAGILQLKVMGF